MIASSWIVQILIVVAVVLVVLLLLGVVHV